MIDKLSISQLVVLGVLGLGTLAVCAARLRSAVSLLAAMVFFSTLGVALTWTKIPVPLIIQPLQAARSDLYVACAVLIAAACLFHVNALSGRRISIACVILFLINLYAGLIRIAAGYVESGAATLAFAVVTLGPLLFLVPALLRELDDWVNIPRWLGFFTALWVFFVGLQIVVDWRKLVEQTTFSRFQGLTSNPQNAGLFLAVSTVVITYLFMADPRRGWRLLWGPLAGVCAILLLWTGSRTGAAMCTIGMTALLYARLGRAILFLPFAALLAYGAYSVFLSSGVELSFDRLTSKSDTRGEAWGIMIRDFLSSPVIGRGTTDEAEVSENSYLFGLSSYGAGMGLLMLCFVIASGLTCLSLFRRRFSVNAETRRIIDVILSFHAMYFAGTLFEGYIVSRVNQMVPLFFIFSSMASCLIRKIDEDRALAAQSRELQDHDAYDQPATHHQGDDDYPYAHAY